MPLVPAGDKTGEYYIIIAGLPWNASWQKLKDFARNQQLDGSYIEIDHAMIYPQNQTNGWVRVKGRDNFLRAFAHLNGGLFEHRALLADGRNETQPAMLADLGFISPSQRGRNDSTATSYSSSSANPGQLASPFSPQETCSMDYSSSSGYSGQLSQPFSPQELYNVWNQQPQINFSPVSPSWSHGSFYQPPSPIYEASQSSFAMSQPVVFTAAPQPAMVYAGNMAPSTPVYLPQGQPMYPCYPITMNTGLMSPPNTVRAIQHLPESNSITGPVVQTEARKVIIKGLPRDASEAAVVNLIDQSYSKSSSKSSRPCSSHIQHVDLARHSDGRLKGHAFVVFQTHRIAQKVVDALDGYKMQGRQLRAVLAKEGVEPMETFHQQQNGYTTPDALGRLSESPAMIHGQVDERHDAALTEQWNDSSERSSKSSKKKSRDSANDDRSRKARPKSRDPTRTSPPVADGSGRKRR